MSGVFKITKDTIMTIPTALLVGFFWVALVFTGEGLQHYVEYRMGMFENPDQFKALQNSPKRLAFGVVKAITVITAAFFIPISLNRRCQKFPRRTLRRRLLLFSPYNKFGYFLALILLCGPLIWFHMQLNYLAMDHSAKIPILIFDSIVVAGISLLLGTLTWVALPKPHPSNAGLGNDPS